MVENALHVGYRYGALCVPCQRILVARFLL